jgi:hypothetical protein
MKASAFNSTTLLLRPSLALSPRVKLVGISVVRAVRGCDAHTVRKSVCDSTHPNFIRWVFDVAGKPARNRDLRFWKDEVFGQADAWMPAEDAIKRILGSRRTFPRGEIEVQWTINAMTISRLVRAGELTEVNHELTRASLAAFLERRLQ